MTDYVGFWYWNGVALYQARLLESARAETPSALPQSRRSHIIVAPIRRGRR